MNLLAKLAISTKVLSLLLMLGAITLAVALAGSHSLSTVAAAYTVMVKEAKAPVLMARVNRRATEMVYAGYRTMAYPGASNEAKAAAAEEQKAYDSGKDMMEQALAAKPDLGEAIADFSVKFDRIHALTQRAIAIGLTDNDKAATAALAEIDPLANALGKQMAARNQQTSAAVDLTAASLVTTVQSQSSWLLTLSLIGIAVSVGVGVLVSRFGIVNPLARLNRSMQTLAAGDNGADVAGTERGDEIGAMAKVVLVFRETSVAKAAADAEKAASDATVQMVVDTLGASLSELSNRDLTTRVTADYPGVYAVLKDNYNEAIGSVRTTIEQVSESARTISTGADEIAQASEDLARRTEDNAASLEETSAALVQIEGRLKATATASQSTVTRADQAMATVDTGRITAGTAKRAMDRVSGSAKGIDDVIEGLDKIAFQTRVLAMNAAVEAGRAGDAGRGFAVVADLVSALAMRAEEEAKRARDQLSITQLEIVTAVDAVGKVDTALAAISADVGEVNHLLAGMASDNQAQSSAITEITAAVSSMDRATQQNAAMVEETSAAARNLTQEVGHLASAAAQFNVDGGGTRRPPIARPAGATTILTSRAPTTPRRPAPKLKAVANGHAIGHANGHASGTAAESDWSDF